MLEYNDPCKKLFLNTLRFHENAEAHFKSKSKRSHVPKL